MIFTAYLDESGTHAGSPATLIGGLLGTVEQWEKLKPELRKLKTKYGFNVFHGKEFKSSAGEFRGWSREKKKDLLEEMVECSGKCLMYALLVRVDNGLYQTEYRGGTTPQRFRHDTAYGLACRISTIQLTHEIIRRFGHHKKFPNTQINLVLEAGHRNYGDAERAFNEVRRALEAAGHPILRTITKATKSECDPLMFSDFVAHSGWMKTINNTWNDNGVRTMRHQGRASKGGIVFDLLDLPPGGLTEFKSHALGMYAPNSPGVVTTSAASRI